MENRILSCWFDGFNRRDWEVLEELYSDDALVHGKEGAVRGGQGVVGLASKWLEAIPDAKIDPLYFSEEKYGVFAVHWRAEGTFKNPIREIPASGKKVAFHGLTCFRITDQKVVEHWACVDYRPLTQ